MPSVIESLLEVVDHDPYPVGHTSLYWRLEGEQITVARRGQDVLLRGFGRGTGGRQNTAWRAAHALERFSYRQVTASLRAYPRLWTLTRQLARDLLLGVTFDVWKCAVILAVLADHWEAYQLSPRTFAMIGDGNGFLGTLIRRAVPQARVYCIDLPKALVFQAFTHKAADGQASMARLGQSAEVGADVVFVLPQEIERVVEAIDCAVNIASMQEMSCGSIAGYFTWLRRRSQGHSRFYCVNREEKALPGGEVARFADYSWRPNDEVFLDGACPYYTHYLSRSMRPHGPALLGLRMPFINYFDGPMKHRLVRLAPG